MYLLTCLCSSLCLLTTLAHFQHFPARWQTEVQVQVQGWGLRVEGTRFRVQVTQINKILYISGQNLMRWMWGKEKICWETTDRSVQRVSTRTGMSRISSILLMRKSRKVVKSIKLNVYIWFICLFYVSDRERTLRHKDEKVVKIFDNILHWTDLTFIF